MNIYEPTYKKLLEFVLNNGILVPNRTGTDAITYFGGYLDIDVSQNFPMITSRKMYFKNIVFELLWFLKGETNIQFLKDNNVSIWNAWADGDGNVGKIYGYQWRKWNGYIDQVKKIMDTLKNNPYDRRMVVSAWNVGELDQMNLPPCHILWQVYPDVSKKELSLSVYMRSVDLFVGLPYDVGLYSLLLYILSDVIDYKPKRLIFQLGNMHIYSNYLDAVYQYLKNSIYPSPTLKIIDSPKDIDKYTFSNFKLENYMSHPSLKISVPV